MKDGTGFQKAWGLPISIEMSLEGVGAVVFILGVLAGRAGSSSLALAAMIVGLVAILLATLVLIFDLGRPLRAPLVFLNLRSPMSLGALTMVFYALFGVLTAAFWVFDWPRGALYSVVAALASIFALGVAIYPGFVLSASKGVPLWHRSLLPVVFAAMATASGLALFLALAAGFALAGVAMAGDLELSIIGQWALGATVVAALTVATALLLVRATPTGSRSVAALKGNAWFWLGAAIGILLPAIVLALPTLVGNAALTLSVGVVAVAGWFLLRHLLITAGAMEPMQVMGAEIVP